MLTDRSRIARPVKRLALCSSLAIATALVVGSSAARAQSFTESFQGVGTPLVAGSATITTGTNSTTITLNATDVVIDWTTFDTATGGGPINFQPSGTTATFQRIGSDFSVLNRIIPTDPSRAVQFNGTVIGQIQSTTTAPGGDVYFYSPGGVIVGSTAVFNVGNLGLTSIAPAVVGGQFVQGTGSEFVQFNGAVTPGSAVTIQAGARINSGDASNQGYVAIVAPVVSQRGTITVNGVATLVSADAATITFNPNGLFDIQVTLGTSGNLGGLNGTLFNDGTITGPAFSGTGVMHRIYAVAVPKNDVITLAINGGSTLGFNVAGAADVVGNAVVLSAGRDIVAGNIASGPSAGGGSGSADLNISGSTITSALTGTSTRDTSLFSTLVGPNSRAHSTVSLRGDSSADIAADGVGAIVTLDRAVTLNADRTGSGVTGGRTDIFAINGGQVNITAGGAILNARGIGAAGATPGTAGGNATGGVAIVQALSGGDVSITGPVNLNAGGFGGAGNAAAGGSATGGRAQIFARDTGSSITINGTTNVGGNSVGGVGNGAAGGNGTGGTSLINAQVASGGSIAINGITSINSNGTGGNASGGGAGGFGTGGTAVAAASDGNTVQFGGNLDVFGVGVGGNATGGGGAGGSQGGAARITLFSGGAMTIGGNAQVFAPGLGAQGNGATATATGGLAQVTAQQNSTLDVTGFLNALSGGIGTGDPGTGSLGQGGGVGGTTLVSAFTGGSIDVGTVLRARSVGTATGNRNATGGTADVQAFSGGDITANELNIQVNGLGGNDTGTGAGNGTGGTGRLTVNGAGSTVTIANGNSTGMNVNGDLDFITAQGFGGQTNTTGGTGGTGTGGTAAIFVQAGGSLTGPATSGSQGFVRLVPRGTGGNANANNATGGQAIGGTVNIVVDGGTMTSANLLPSSFANAGTFAPSAATSGFNIIGGNATGGLRNITVTNGSSLTTQFGGGGPGAQGGNGLGTGRGGDGTGGSASLVVDNGSTLSLTGSSTVFSQNAGGAGGSAGMGGNGIAGSAFVRVANGSTLTMAGPTTNTFSVNATAFGGFSETASLTGTNSTGGNSTFVIENATANLQTFSVTATGEGGSGLVAQGGNGTGGTARLQLNGGTLTGNTLEVSAEAFGGEIGAAASGNGGMATGGSASIQVNAGSNTLTFNTINVTADAEGGDVSGTAGNGGAGVGGIAQISVTGGASLTVNASNTVIESDGLGGDALSLTGNGGGGNAGRAILLVNGASANFNGNVSLSGDSGGGAGINGGTAFGDPENNNARAVVAALSGSLTITGLTSLHAVAGGGAGNLSGNGGNASGGLANVGANNFGSGGALATITLGNLEIESSAQGGTATGTGNGGTAGAGRAHLFVNGGTITIGGDASVVGEAVGGAGVNGGNAISAQPDRQPRALVGSFNGTIDVGGSTFLSASAFGGGGRLGGTGGVAFAGQAAVDAQSPNGSSTISLGGLDLEASALGGSGGAGVGGQAGGAGGDAYGGPASAFGNAGRGVLTVRGNALVRAGARGGTGGQGGGGGETTPGAVGGTGGRAFGGALTVGTRSGVETLSNTGSATFAQVSGDANALGGAGGAGGFGTTQGAGGAGGAGFGGSAGILVRGSPATFGNVTLTANGTGGNGGLGAVQGDGGDGYAGDGFVNVTQRFMRTERGSLTANNVNITSAGIGGTGATVGDTFYSAATGAESDFFIRQADVSLANLVLTTSGALAPNFTTTILSVVDPVVSGIPVPISVTVAAEPFDLAMADSTASIAGNFTLSTPGDMRVSLASSTLNVGSLTLSAGNFVLPVTRPATLGTINVSGILNVFSGLDFLAYANFSTVNDAFFEADGSVLTGDLTSAGTLFIDALGSITTGNVSADQVGFSAGTNLATGAVVSGDYIELEAGGTATTGQLTGGGDVQVSSGGAVAVAGASAGIVNPSTDPETDYTIVLRSLTSIVAGDLSARGNVAVGSPGSIMVGNVTSGSAGRGFLALAGTGLATGSIDTSASANGGLVYLANFSMEPLGGELANEFNPDPVLAASPVAIGGPIALNGAVSTGRFQAATTGAFTAQAITAPNLFQLAAGADVTLGDISSFIVNVSSAAALTTGAVTSTATAAQLAALSQTNGVILTAANGALATGAIQAGGGVDLTAGGAVTVGAITAGTSIEIDAGLGITGAAMTAGSLIEAEAGGAIQLGNLTGGQSVNLDAGTTLTAGNIVAGPDPITQFSMGLVATGNIGLGNLTGSNTIGIVSETGSITAGNVTAGRSLLALARGGVGFGGVTTGALATDFTYIANSSMVSLGGPLNDDFNPAPIFAATPVATTGSIAIAGAVATGTLRAATTGTIAVGGGIATSANTVLNGRAGITAGAITAGQGIALFGGSGAITASALQAGDSIIVSNSGSVLLGDISAGLVQPSASPGALYRVVVENTGGSVTTGSIAARRDVGIQAPQAISTGNISGRDVLLLPGTGLTTGSIQALNGTQPSGRVYVGNYSMASTTNGFVSSIFTNLPLFNLEPVRTGGPITINGAVTAGSLFASTAQAITLGAVTAGSVSQPGFIDIDSGGLASIVGALRGDRIDIASHDIDITANGSLDALSLTGEIQLASNNPNGIFVGDNASPASGSYQLSNAEFGRLKAGEIAIVGNDLSGTVDMVVGDLSVTAAQLYIDGQALFATGNRAAQTPSGILRVNGTVSANGFGLDSSGGLTFLGGTFELNAATGLISVTSSGNAIAGTIEIDASQIHVASDEILLRLRADPFYAGHVAELNAPAAIQRPDGVLRANSLDLEGDRTIYIQNTGSAVTPAGFVTRVDTFDDEGGSSMGPGEDVSGSGNVKIVINGQVQTDSALLTGKAAFDLIIAQARSDLDAGEEFGADLDPTSTLNGCVITTGVCAFGQNDPVAAISSEITVITGSVLDDSPVAPTADDSDEGDESGSNEPEDEDSEGDEGSSPIAPPTPLISTRALDGDVTVVEPVSGAGNPALFGSAVNETTVEGETP